jgi:hypothetical protein
MQFWREETPARLLPHYRQSRESLPWQRPLLVGQFEYRINPRALGLEPLTTISRTHFSQAAQNLLSFHLQHILEMVPRLLNAAQFYVGEGKNLFRISFPR